MFYVVCYDIADDRRRRKIEKIVKGFGRRVQESVFECELADKRFCELQNRLSATIDNELDNVRIYQQCKRCKENIQLYGISPEPGTEQTIVI